MLEAATTSVVAVPLSAGCLPPLRLALRAARRTLGVRSGRTSCRARQEAHRALSERLSPRWVLGGPAEAVVSRRTGGQSVSL